LEFAVAKRLSHPITFTRSNVAIPIDPSILGVIARHPNAVPIPITTAIIVDLPPQVNPTQYIGQKGAKVSST
jgi:hypothetical protein